MGAKKAGKGIKAVRKSGSGNTESFELRLYIADSEINSRRALELLQKFCNQFLKGKCSLTVIDVFEDYQSVLRDRVLVAPTLVWIRKGTPAFLIGGFEWNDLLDFFGIQETAGGEK